MAPLKRSIVGWVVLIYALGLGFAAGLTINHAQPPKRSGDRWPAGYAVRVDLSELHVKGLTDSELRFAYIEACQAWESVCGIRFKFVVAGERANLVPGFGRVDGTDHTLAKTMSVYGVALPDSRHDQVFDADEDWKAHGIAYFRKIATHEVGHAIGIHHLYGRSLMSPYEQHTITTLQPPEIAQAMLRYGPPK